MSLLSLVCEAPQWSSLWLLHLLHDRPFNPSGATLWLCQPWGMHGWLQCLAFAGGACLLWCGPASFSDCGELLLGSVPLETASLFPGTHIPCVAVLESLPMTVPLGSGLDTKLPTAASCPLFSHYVRHNLLAAVPCVLCVCRK